MVRHIGTIAKKVVEPVSFPLDIASGGIPGYKIFADLRKDRTNVGSNAQWALTSPSSELVTSEKKKILTLERGTLRNLFGKQKSNIAEIQLGIEEVGVVGDGEEPLHLRQQLKNQPIGDHFWFITKPIRVSANGDYPGLFYLCCNSGGLWIELIPVGPAVRLSPDTKIVWIRK